MTASTFNISTSNRVFAASPVRISAAGDWGCTGNTEQTVNNLKNQNPNLVLALGDYSYGSTPNCWLDLIRPVGSITKINFGNHDVESVMLLNSYLNSFGISKQYYSNNIGIVHIITIATEDMATIGSQQYSFVLKDLEAASADPNIKWIIVSLHEPLYASPNTCGDSGCSGDTTFRDAYHPLFDKYGVDLVLEGHVHNYQRSYPIMYNTQNPSAPIVTSCIEDSYENPSGQIHAIVGTGGVNLHGLSDKAPFMASQQDSKFGMLDIQISDNKLYSTFISNDGSAMDQFSITKTVKKTITDGNLQVQNQNCSGLQPIKIKTQSKKIASSVTLDEDQNTGKLKLDIRIPEIHEEMKKKVDEKLKDGKKRVEDKRQEIKQKLDGINRDTSQSKDLNKLEQKSQNTDNNLEEFKQRLKDRVKSKLSIQTFPLP